VQPNNSTLVVDARHNGPPGSGNGGWTAGLIGAYITDGVAEVTLQKPPPLETPLTVVYTADGLRVLDPSEVVIATARSREDDISPVAAATLAEAEQASSNYPGHGRHHFPTCFVCGPQRPDGLRIYPGKLPDGRTASPFEVPSDVDAVMVWAALDCPGGWAVIEGDRPWVLGRFAVTIGHLPQPGDRCVVVGQAVSREGRKALVRTTLYTPDERVAARGEATWIALPV
jgi:hypothetical protein